MKVLLCALLAVSAYAQMINISPQFGTDTPSCTLCATIDGGLRSTAFGTSPPVFIFLDAGTYMMTNNSYTFVVETYFYGDGDPTQTTLNFAGVSGHVYTATAVTMQFLNLTISGSSGFQGPIRAQGNSVVNIIDSIITQNSGTVAFATEQATLSFSRTTFSSNAQTAPLFADSFASVRVLSTTSFGNTGGVLALTASASLLVKDSSFTNNNQITPISFISNGLLAVLTSTFSQNAGGGSGGAIYTVVTGNPIDPSGGSVFIQDSTFSQNSATRGGAVYLELQFTSTATVVIKRTNFQGNTATTNGGAIYTNLMPTSSSPDLSLAAISSQYIEIENSQFIGNAATGGDGGGLAVFSPTPFPALVYLSSTTSTSNTASGNGGGAFVQNIELGLNTATFNLNSAAQGGGVYFRAGRGLISDSLFDSNSATDGAGAYFSVAQLKVTTSKFVSNVAQGSGGGIRAGASALNLIGNLFSNNSAVFGGGMYDMINGPASLNSNESQSQNLWFNTNFGQLLQINTTTFASNQASLDGGGSFITFDQSSTNFSTNQYISNSAGRYGGGLFTTAPYSGINAFPVDTIYFSNNSAAGAGGGVATNLASFQAQSSIFQFNTAPFGASAAVTNSSMLNFIGCAFLGNGGIEISATNVSVVYSGGSSFCQAQNPSSLLYCDTNSQIYSFLVRSTDSVSTYASCNQANMSPTMPNYVPMQPELFDPLHYEGSGCACTLNGAASFSFDNFILFAQTNGWGGDATFQVTNSYNPINSSLPSPFTLQIAYDRLVSPASTSLIGGVVSVTASETSTLNPLTALVTSNSQAPYFCADVSFRYQSNSHGLLPNEIILIAVLVPVGFLLVVSVVVGVLLRRRAHRSAGDLETTGL